MNLEEIQKIIKMFEGASITSLDIECDGIKIKLTKEAGAQVVVSSPEVAKPAVSEIKTEGNDNFAVKSPLVGTFHKAPYIGGKPFVAVGDKVKKGDKLCIVEAMKVMNEITAPKDGVIAAILVNEGDMVEFDQKLFEIGDGNV